MLPAIDFEMKMAMINIVIITEVTPACTTEVGYCFASSKTKENLKAGVKLHLLAVLSAGRSYQKTHHSGFRGERL